MSAATKVKPKRSIPFSQKSIPPKKTKTTPSKKTSSGRIPGLSEINIPPEQFIQYCTVIYGQKGIGKTTLCSQLSEKSLVCMFEDRYNAPIRMVAFPSCTVEEMDGGAQDPWKEFKLIVEEALTSDEVDLIAVDSIDLAMSACLNSICYDDGISHPGDINDFGATWNAIKLEFRTVMESIRKSKTTGLVLTSHCNEDRMELNTATKSELKKMTVYSPSCSKGAQEYLRQSCDFAFFYGKHGKHRGLHIRWEDNIWTACGNDDYFRDGNGELISILKIPSKNTAGQTVIDAFHNQPSSEVLVLWEPDEEEESED